MSKRIPLGIAIAAALIAVALSVAITVSVYTDSYNQMIRDLPRRTQQYAALSEIDELIRTRYFGETDADSVQKELAAGYVQGLHDEQCFFVRESDKEAYLQTVAGNIPGTGITAVYDPDTGYLTVRDVAEASPAREAGFAQGDLICSVDGAAVTQQNASALIASLLSSERKTAEIGVAKKTADGKEERSTVTLKNGYTAQSVAVKTVGGVGYVRFFDFYANTEEQFNAALDEFASQGIRSLILDVRNNRSANYENAAAVIDRIVPLAAEGTGAIATAKDKNGNTVKLFSADSVQLNMSVAVLINDRTAGAAELLACDLRDFGKAKLFGETTAGEGMYAELFDLESGGAVMLSVAQIRPYRSEPYDGVGVAPDTEVKMLDADKNRLSPDELEGDVQFSAAYAYFTQN